MSNISSARLPPRTGPPIGLVGGDRSYQPDIIVCAAVTAIFGTISVALRFYTRGWILRILGWEDWLILIAQVFSIATCIGFIYGAILGLGLHAWLFPVQNIIPSAKVGWCNILFYNLSLLFSQMSILMLYMRIWTIDYTRKAAYVLIAIVAIYNIYAFVAVMTACIPLQAFWDTSIQGAYCHPKSIWWASTYMHIITDFLIFSLPLPIISRLRFPKRQKVVLFVLFTFGFFVCLVSIVRLVYLIETANTTDYPYDNVSIAFWTCIETNVTVVIACVMTLKPLVSKVFPGLLEGYHARTSGESPVLTIGSKPPQTTRLSRHHPLSPFHDIPEEPDSSEMKGSEGQENNQDTPAGIPADAHLRSGDGIN